MEISTVGRVEALRAEGVSPLYSIWITEDVHEEEPFSVEVWDEIENEREEDLEEGGYETVVGAEKALQRIVAENPEVTFVRLSNQKN